MMSNSVTPTSAAACADNENKACLNDVIFQHDTKFHTASPQIQSNIQETKSGLEGFLGVLEKEKVEEIICLLQAAKLKEAQKLLDARFPTPSVGTILTIFKAAYFGNIAQLVNIIHFAQGMSSVSLKARAYSTIYEEIKLKGHTGQVEILLLRSSVLQIVDQSEDDPDLRKMMDELNVDKDELVAVITNDFNKQDFQKCILICSRLGSQIIFDLMPEIVNSTYTGTVDNTINFIKLLEAIPCYESAFLALELAFDKLEATGQAESEQALHLWALCLNLHMTDYSGRIKCRTCLAMYLKKGKYFKIYEAYIEEPLKHDIVALHTKNRHMIAIVYHFTPAYLRWNLSRVQPLIKALTKIPDQMDSIKGLEIVFNSLRALYQLETHEAFQRYRALQKFPTEFHGCRSYNIIKNSIPKCISNVLQSNSKKCIINNKFYQEPLIVVANTICTWIPRNATPEGKHWTILIDDVTDLVKFKWDTVALEMNTTIVDVKAPKMIADGPGWKIKPVRGGRLLKIFNNNGFLTVSTDEENRNQRTVSVEKENDSSFQLWKIEIINSQTA